ncbi:MAG: hypothetical protein QM811_25070 [Pirellulales bacterium]
MPGLIAAHAHVGGVDGISVGVKNYTRANIERQLTQYERYGVTTVMSLGLNAPLFAELRADSHSGKLGGAMLYGADRGLGVVDGAPPVQAGPEQLDRPADATAAHQAVRDAARRKPDILKIWVDDFRGNVPIKMSPEVYAAIIDEAHKEKLRVAAHVYYLDDAKKLVAAGVDVIAHGIRDQPVDDELIAAMKSRGVWYIATLQLDESFFLYAERPEWMSGSFFQAALQPELKTQFDDAACARKDVGEYEENDSRQSRFENEPTQSEAHRALAA